MTIIIITIENSKSCPEVLKISRWYTSDYVVLMLWRKRRHRGLLIPYEKMSLFWLKWTRHINMYSLKEILQTLN